MQSAGLGSPIAAKDGAVGTMSTVKPKHMEDPQRTSVQPVKQPDDSSGAGDTQAAPPAGQRTYASVTNSGSHGTNKNDKVFKCRLMRQGETLCTVVCIIQ
jgi:ABC-type molybdate transport system substrate-binding protein